MERRGHEQAAAGGMLVHKLPSPRVLCWDSRTCWLLGVEDEAVQTEQILCEVDGLWIEEVLVKVEDWGLG